jgi:hypothetical protein
MPLTQGLTMVVSLLMVWWLSGKKVQASAGPTPHMFFILLVSKSEFPVDADLGPAAGFLKGLIRQVYKKSHGFSAGGFSRKTTNPSVK